jgi:biotin carboxyl carrier protein
MNENGEYITINYEGQEFRTLPTVKFKKRVPYVPPDPKKIFAFIPGTIMEVFVKSKDKVEKGDKLLSLQAMKMNNIIIAPHKGTIKKVHVEAGNIVIKNQLLVEFR